MASTDKSYTLEGVAASPGILIGRAVVLKRDRLDIKPVPINPSRVPQEIAEFKLAIERVTNELRRLAIAVSKRLGPEYGRIFEAQAMIADDQVINSKVIDLIAEKRLSAAYLYYQEIDKVIKQLARSKDRYFRDRIIDIDSVCTRLLGAFKGAKEDLLRGVEGPTVAIARVFSPSDLVGFSVRKRVGFAMEVGGVTSHTAFLAKSLSLPAVIGLGRGIEGIDTGDQVILDGFTGKLIINPEKQVLVEYRQRQRFFADFDRKRTAEKDWPAVTTDGIRVRVMSNIELPSETAKVLKSGAEGIGLYRSEYIFMADGELPSMNEQYKIYKSVLQKMGDLPVIIRTFDMGGDKFSGNSSQPVDANPFLGWRAIRFCLDHPEVFKDQIKALLKSSTYGNLEIMLPMISNLDEVREAKRLIQECKNELAGQNVRLKDRIPLGIMIEVPSAVLLADHLAAEVDFFSLGTNDLIQYVLAVDRTNEMVTRLYQSYNPAVLKMIYETIKAGHRRGVRVGLCGEVAADPYGVVLLVGFGIDELSVNFSSTAVVKQVIRTIDRKRASLIARKALRMKTAAEVEGLIKASIRSYFPDLVPLIEFLKGTNNG